jgi:hypothetical protein
MHIYGIHKFIFTASCRGQQNPTFARPASQLWTLPLAQVDTRHQLNTELSVGLKSKFRNRLTCHYAHESTQQGRKTYEGNPKHSGLVSPCVEQLWCLEAPVDGRTSKSNETARRVARSWVDVDCFNTSLVVRFIKFYSGSSEYFGYPFVAVLFLN